MKQRPFKHFFLLILLYSFIPVEIYAKDIVIENNKGVKCIIKDEAGGYAFGSIYLNGELIEKPLLKGIMMFKDIENEKEYWLYAKKAKKESNDKATLSGSGDIGGAKVDFKVTFKIPPDVKAVKIIYDFNVNKDIQDRCAVLQFNTDFANSWKCHMYPWVENSKWIARDTLDWMGIPSLFMYRTDMSMGILWGIDPNSDYLNPKTWTKNFGLFFTDRVIPAQFHVGGTSLKKNVDYHCPMQIVLTNKSDPDDLIIDLMENWISLNNYKVEPLYVRSNDKALDLFIKGRTENPESWIPGKGYSLHGRSHTRDFMYMGVQGMAAYFDYLLYEMTGDPMWRERAFQQMDFIREGQNWDESSLNYGAVHTSYVLSEEYGKGYGPSPPGWNSDDRWNIGYKPDICALCAQYMLKLWKLVKNHEGVDRKDWYESAINMIEFIIRQQNEDGGLAQKVQIEPLELRWHAPWGNLVATPIKFRSSTSGRALPSFGDFYKITGEERYRDFMEELEEYHLEAVQNKYFYTGHHPDLPPWELTEASIWGVSEYWLDRYEDTGKEKYLKHAIADLYLAMTWWVPKQLSWVDNPTQGGAAEQQHYLSLTMYCYQNRKVECLKHLYNYTQKPLFKEIYDMVVQTNYWTQKETPDGAIGGIHERTSRPWRARVDESGKPNYNSLGSWYFNEQALDLFVQIFEMYRMGRNLYFSNGLTHKIYQDGICYYSKDISQYKKVGLSVLPSSGSIIVIVNFWDENAKKWTVSDASQDKITSAHKVDNLKPNSWYDVYLDKELYNTYQSNQHGVMEFSYTGSHKDQHIFEVKAK